jgi:inner membrane protein
LPTLIGHLAVPLAARLGLGGERVGRGLLATSLALSVLPDADVVGVRFGVRYGDFLGHRGFSHSILFALLAAAVCALAWRSRVESPAFVFGLFFVAALSHGVLDAFTNGGLGVAFFSPFDDGRYFAPIRPIDVSPLGLRAVVSRRGLAVLGSELVWLWLPLMSAAALVASRRRTRRTVR